MVPMTLDCSLLNLVAHEMRAPLAIIEGYLSMLDNDDLDEAGRGEARRVMKVKAKELDALADLLVTAARLETTELLREPAVFDIHEAVAAAVQRIEPRARLDGATVEAFGIETPAWVYVDRGQVTRVLTNLLHNALTYSVPSAQVAIEVRAGQPVEVAVTDRGVGIAAEHQARIFERFSRFNDGGPNRTSGLGLGLSISRDLAELNDGELLLERSAPGEGSVFVLRLPVIES